MAQSIRQDFPTDGSEFIQGATIKDIGISILINGSASASPVVAAAIALKEYDTVVHRYDSANGSITIAPAGDSITIVSHILDIPGKDYKYDLRLEFDDGTVTRWMWGIWRLRENVTPAI